MWSQAAKNDQPIEKLQSFEFNGFPHGLRTSIPSSQIERTELSVAVNVDIDKGGKPITRDPIIKYTTTATTSNSAVKTIAGVNIGGTNRTLVQDAAHKVYYLDSAPKPVYIAALTANAKIISYNGVAILMDGSYLKYMDDVAGINLCYDDGIGLTAYQYNNTCGNDDTSTAMYSGSVTKVGSKITTLAWDAGYTIPLTKIEVWLSKTGSPTGDITATLYDSTGANLLKSATETLDSTLLTSYPTKHIFRFGNAYDMALSTAYIFNVNYSGGDVDNCVNVHASTVSSGGKQYQYDGSWANVSTKDPMIGVFPGRPPKASFGAVKGSRLFVSGDPDNPGYVWFSNLTHLDWSSTPDATGIGGGKIGAVDDHKDTYTVGAMDVLYDDLIIYGTERTPYISILTGETPDLYKLPLTFQRSWATSKTLVSVVNDLWAGSSDGVDQFTGVQEYGDFRTFSASDPVSDRIDDNWSSSTSFADYYPPKGQYLLVMPTYHRVLAFGTKHPISDPYQRGTRYPTSEHEYYRDVFTRAAYKWTASGSGTNEYYVEIAAGGDPSIVAQPDFISMNDTVLTEGTVGSLTNLQWDYGDNDTLGYSTVYVRDNSGDPDTTGVTIRSILLPTSMANVTSDFLIGGSDGFIYTKDPTGYLDQSTHQMNPRVAGPYMESPFGDINVVELHLIAASKGGGTVGVYLYKDGDTTTETVSKAINIDITHAPLHEDVNFDARSIYWELKEVTMITYPIIFGGILLKYRRLE